MRVINRRMRRALFRISLLDTFLNVHQQHKKGANYFLFNLSKLLCELRLIVFSQGYFNTD